MSEIRNPIKKTSIKTKDKIVQKGFFLMCQKGYHHIHSADIAQHIGISTGCIYQYFKDKKDIFIAGAQIYLQMICFPLLDGFKFFRKMEADMFVDYLVQQAIKQSKKYAESYKEIMSLCCLDQDIANIYRQKELDTTEKIMNFTNYTIKKENSHLLIYIIRDFCEEVVYHQHLDYDYSFMQKKVKQMIKLLLYER